MMLVVNQEINFTPKEVCSSIRWFGGKAYLASRICAMLPQHLHYCEPYFGGGAVLFAKPPEKYEGISEVVNDIDGELMNFWSVLRDPVQFAQFQRMCEATPFSQELHHECYANLRKPSQNAQERAWRFFVANRQSRQGMFRAFATLSRRRTRRGMNEQAASWLSAVDGLPEVHDRLRRVVILNQDAIKTIKQQDGPDTCFYVDPPYLHETRAVTDAYAFEMSDRQHETLLETLSSIQGLFILSGYDNPLYRHWQHDCGWRCAEIRIDNKASSAETKPVMTECLWINY